MRVGLHIGIADTKQKRIGEQVARDAALADQAGFATLVIQDHFSLRPESTPYLRGANTDAPLPAIVDSFEAWSTLAFIAACTKNIKLSTMVSGITMRYPAVLVKTVDTLDALSNGRAYLGVGASPDFGKDEHARMGMPFPGAGERVARLAEVLEMALQLWSGEDKPFDGTYYQLASTIGEPFFIQKPHPPIMIAGHGKKMMRLMAKYADAINIGFGGDLNDLRERLAVIRAHCQELNRSYQDIQKTTFFMTPIVRDGHVDTSVLDYIAGLGEIGFDEIIIRNPGHPAELDVLATELLPAVAKIAVAGR